ncbi:MAG: LLM class flavin-dependent oxidoreductase, partial [Xanthomonadaceae bacterium]|nr:LLM class flavin-dependent oxidoreductase [Xanthomonadaceae bacterium]
MTETLTETVSARHFGLFDHLDNNGTESPGEHYRQRLALIGQCDDGTFHGYHLAEHHCTPLGQACSPSVFLAAVAARTERLRIIPTIYPLPLYHPIRLLEEVAMLDHLSQGRLEIGVGPGGSPPEQLMFGVNPEQAMPAFMEAYDVFKQGLTSGKVRYDGKHFQFDRSEVFMRCQQTPHPPLWYGASSDRSVQWLAGEGMNMLTGGNFERLRLVSATYRQHYRSALDGLEPKVGAVRRLVIAETDEQALQVADPAYRRWFYNMNYLWEKSGTDIGRFHRSLGAAID